MRFHWFNNNWILLDCCKMQKPQVLSNFRPTSTDLIHIVLTVNQVKLNKWTISFFCHWVFFSVTPWCSLQSVFVHTVWKTELWWPMHRGWPCLHNTFLSLLSLPLFQFCPVRALRQKPGACIPWAACSKVWSERKKLTSFWSLVYTFGL